MGDKQAQQKRLGSIAWWIIVCVSVPFSLYTLLFASGRFEIYKHFTVNANFGRPELAGLHIKNNVLLWQAHAIAAFVYVAIGPFQFNPAWRNKHIVMHRQLGYAFAAATVLTSITGSFMLKDTRLGPIAKRLVRIMGPLCLIALVISVNAARSKDLQSHRIWMIRSAAIGYAVMYTRMIPRLIEAILKCSPLDSLDYSFVISYFGNIILSEFYIQYYLAPLQKNRTKKPSDSLSSEINEKKVS